MQTLIVQVNHIEMSKTFKTKKKQSESAEWIEDPNALRERLSKTEEFLDKNRRWVFIAGGALVVVIVAFLAFNYYIDRRDQAAQANMFQAQYYFEADSLNLALEGDGNDYGFLEIIDEYAMTEAANLAQYYAGVSFLRLGEYEDAIKHLKKFSSKDLLIQARAYSLIGDAYMEQEDYTAAARFYKKAANYKPNEFFTPTYMMKHALANELGGNVDAAIKVYKKLVDKYPNSDRMADAKKELARLGAATN